MDSREGEPDFYSHYRQLRESIQTSLGPHDDTFVAMADVARGEVPSVSVPVVQVQFNEYWKLLPNVDAFLKQKPRQALDAEEILRRLDPLNGRYPDVHGQFHQIALTDQRVILNMMIYAEAWLRTAANRRSRWGGVRANARGN